MFEDIFALDPKTARVEELAGTSLPPVRKRQPGIYSEGLIVLVGRSFSRAWLKDWPGLTDRLEPFAYTALGDVFCWDRQKHCVQYLTVQEGSLDDVADSIDHLLDEVLVRQEVIDDFLLRPFVGEIRSLHGPLQYGQCYISIPWQMLGGGADPKQYDPGAVDVYLSLIGQTHFG
ncbi:MAG TPA: T6SS immunity protein Tdi1 domain-containing protein [Thermoanaerobaculia bacterium]|nr:T6SS immunity protein Tdi1 domain-containing protein [Thermoanaerobaculia bacterium]